MKSISVVICAYNEEKNINVVVEEAVKVLASMAVDHEIILVDDGSTDRTLQAMRSLALNNDRIKIITHAQNEGIGSALLDGYNLAQKDLVTFLPADGQISPRDVKLLADNIDGHDLVVSYYIKKPSSLLRKLTSKGARMVIFLLFGGMPRYEGTYMFRRGILKTIPLKMRTSFVLNYELVLRFWRQGYNIKEVPTTCLERISGASKVLGVKKVMYILSQLIALRLKF